MPNHEHSQYAFVPSITITARRLAATVMERTIFPAHIERNDSLQELDRLLADGYGVIFFVPHFSLREMYQLPFALAKESDEVAKRRALFPIAAHQYSEILKKSERIMQVDFIPVVTDSTRQKVEDLQRRGKKIPWEMPETSAEGSFLQMAQEFVASNGLVFVAPQVTRVSHLEPFPNRYVGYLLRATRNIEKVAIAVVGVEIEGAKTYEKNKVGGINVAKPYIYRLGWVGTREQLKEIASLNGHSVDMQVFWFMNEVAPEPYRAKTPDGILIFSR